MSDTLPFQKHSETSKAAAEKFSVKAPGARRQCYDYIQANEPCSDRDQQRGLDMPGDTQRPRRIELESAGHVRAVGTVDDEDGTGRVVYVATDKPYPKKPPTGYWKSRMREIRAEQPTPEEFAEATRVLVEARKILPKGTYTRKALNVFNWIGRHARGDEDEE